MSGPKSVVLQGRLANPIPTPKSLIHQVNPSAQLKPYTLLGKFNQHKATPKRILKHLPGSV